MTLVQSKQGRRIETVDKQMEEVSGMPESKESKLSTVGETYESVTYEEVAEAVKYCLHKYGDDYEFFDIAVQDTIRSNRFSEYTFSLLRKASERS